MQSRLLATSMLVTSLAAALSPARADDSEARLNALERQIHALQGELQRVRRDMAAHNEQVRALARQAARSAARLAATSVGGAGSAAIPEGYALVKVNDPTAPAGVALMRVEPAPPAPTLPMGAFRVGGATVTLGGFIEAAGIYRTRNEVADVTSNFNTGLPLPNSPNYHQGEFRGTARQSRFSALVQGKPDEHTLLSAYGELDLLGAAPTANSVESNSYNVRMRHLYAAYDRSDLGFYVLAGQTWSLLTMDKKGIAYLQGGMNIPLTVDAQYVPGFTWARQPQVRVVKTLDGGLFNIAASLENPQANYYTGPNGLTPSGVETININNAGGSGFASTTNYSSDIAPDVIVKASADPGFGHFEAYGLGRFLHDRVSELGSGTSNTHLAGGVGAAALIHVIPGYLDIQGSFLAGDGIGRYGSAQLPDAVVGADGNPVPLPEVEALVGLVGHPDPLIDIYGYLGTEQISRRYFAADVKGKPAGFGYGSPLYDNSSCDEELGSSSDCVGNTSGIVQGTVGGWWKFLHGDYGTMQVGPQYSYTHRAVFQGVGPTPKTDDNMLLLSFRYYPFQ